MKFLETVRYNEWWVYKLCPLLGIGYATLLIYHFSFLKAGFFLLFLLIGIIIGAVYVSQINDVTDLKEDIACGKRNRMEKVPAKKRWLFPGISLFAIGIIFLYFLSQDLLTGMLYLMACVAFSLYSIEPFRLKRRGFLGVLADASGSHLFPSLFFVSAISNYVGVDINWYWFSCVGVWALCYGFRGILWHQFQDRENDQKVGLKTFASSINPRDFGQKEQSIFYLEIAALTGMLYIIGEPLPLIFLVLYAVVVTLRYKIIGQQIALIRTPPSNFFQLLMIDYYQVFLPLSLLVAATIQYLPTVCLLIIHILLFPQKLWAVLKDIFYSVRRIWTQLA